MKLVLPRGYLSPSQVNLWLKNKNDYREKYYHGNDTQPVTEAIKLGKEVAEHLEGIKKSKDDTIALVALMVMRYGNPETKLRTTLKTRHGNVDILCIADDYQEVKGVHDVLEYKTGMTRWNQAKVDESLQVQTYGLVIWNRYGVVPNVTLQHLPTKINPDGTRSLTGKEPKTIKANITVRSIIRAQSTYAMVALQIHEDYKQFRESLC